ncbi:MAG: hypothetical protein ABIX28_10865, partial [Vicinamibacterales bacterium]
MVTKNRFRSRGFGAGLAAALFAVCWSVTVTAQLDPLYFMKRVPPTVIVVMDTSLAMLEDGAGNFYDPSFYKVADDPTVMGAFASVGTAKTYRRTYKNLQNATAPGKYTADSISAVAAAWDPANPLTSANAGDKAYLDPTRYHIAKTGLAAAV